MKNLSFKQAANLLMLTLANLLIFTACSKSGDEPTAPTVKTPERLKAWEPKPVVDTTQTYMPFLTTSEGTVTLTATASGTAWVDTNNNGVFDEGTDVKVTEPAQTITFTAPNKVFTVYGSVTELNAAGNALTAADVANNPALTKLNVAKNNLNEAALTHLINSFPTAPTADASVVLRSTEGESNEVSKELRENLAKKGWKPMRLNKEGAEEEDKEAPEPDPKPQPDPDPKPEEDKTPPTLGTMKVTNTTHNQTTVQWDAATDNVTPQAELHYQLLLYQADGTTLVKDYGEMKAFSYTLQGLTPSTQYVVKVKVTDKANNSIYYELKVTTEGNPEPYIQLTTTVPINGLIRLDIDAAPQDRKDVWIDLNGNNIKDEGDAVPKFDTDNNDNGPSVVPTYTLKAQTIRIYGKVTVLDCSSIKVTALDFTHNKALSELYAYDNSEQITIKGANKLTKLALDVGVFHINKNNLILSELTHLYVLPSDGVTTVNTAGLTKLQTLLLEKCNNITSLDLSTNTELKELSIGESGLTSLDLSKQTKLTKLGINDCENITSLNLSNNTELKGLLANDSGLTSLDVSKQTKLTVLEIKNAPLTKLNISNCKKLTSLNLSTNTELTELLANNAGLTSLDVSKLQELHTLKLAECPLTKLKSSKTVPLKEVDVSFLDVVGLRGTAFDEFIATLPDRKEAKDGKITLNMKQGTETLKKVLKELGWEVITVGKIKDPKPFPIDPEPFPIDPKPFPKP